MKVLVTGAAGFIGAFTSKQLAEQGHQVVGIDSMNDDYVPNLKRGRLDWLGPLSNFQFEQIDLVDSAKLDDLFDRENFDRVIHLAAQAGDVVQTHAQVDDLIADVGFASNTELKDGLGIFANWYREYYR